MAGGQDIFRTSFSNYASKIDGDPGLEAATKAHFWSTVEDCGAMCAGGADQCGCCASFEMQGNVVPLSSEERLGTTQRSMWVALSIANQDGRLSPPDVLQMFTEFEMLPAREGLVAVHRNFSTVRITTGSRMFAFRNPDDPNDPWADAPLVETFRRLAIPDDDMDDRLAFEFSCDNEAHIPSSLDANLRNAAAFQYGGMTSPPPGLVGLPEVIVLPPLGNSLTKVPRAFA